MSTRVEWTCDGCGQTKMVQPTRERPDDWHVISVTLEGFAGYPVSEQANGRETFDLCASCQRSLVSKSNPRQWPRVLQDDGR